MNPMGKTIPDCSAGLNRAQWVQGFPVPLPYFQDRVKPKRKKTQFKNVKKALLGRAMETR
jgi:hypothetical protein